MPLGFGKRTYQHWIHVEDLVQFRVEARESKLLILAERDFSELARQSLRKCRAQIAQYILEDPAFQTSLEPCDVKAEAPAIIQQMAAAARQTGVGPFAAVAGAIAEYVGQKLLAFSSDVLVENGGDIFAAGIRDRIIGVYAGNSPLSGKLALNIDATRMPCGICTSSGTVGHSLSFGKADVAIVLARTVPLADACATALGNMIATSVDIERGLEFVAKIRGVEGAVIIVGKELGVWGDLQLIKTSLL